MNINRRKFRSYSERNDRQPLIPHVQTSRSFYDTTHNSTACAQQHRRYRRNRPRSLPLVPTEATVDRSLSGSLPSTTATISEHGSYDVNNPPSVPSSPKFGGDSGYPDVLLPIPDGGHQLSYGKDKTGLKQAIDQVNSQSADIFNVDSERPDIEEQTHHDYKENVRAESVSLDLG